MSRRGFTLLELLLALVIGAVVTGGGFSLVMLIQKTDEGFMERLETTSRLAFVQRTVARSLQSIVVAPAGFDAQAASDAAARTARAATRRLDAPDQPEEEPIDPVEPPPVPPAPPRFRLGPVVAPDGTPDRRAKGVRRLELLLARAPVGDRAAGPVRGALDLVETPNREGMRWRLQWTPIAPAGKPTILLEHLVLAEWSVTDSHGQFDTFEAYEQNELPWAVRTIFWTEAGTKVDWMFDLGAASTTADPR